MQAGLYDRDSCFSIVAIIYDRGFDKEEDKEPTPLEVPTKPEDKPKVQGEDDSASQFRGFRA